MNSDREYHRLLAELSPKERLRLLHLDYDLLRILDSKRRHRRKLANLPPAEKLRILQELRARSQLQRGRRRSASLSLPTVADKSRAKRANRKAVIAVPAKAPRFGGRATASGVNYEARIASLIGVKMLCASRCNLWNGVSGADISAITLQAPEPVDDIVLDLREASGARIFISAKERSTGITLSDTNPTFSEIVDAFVRQFLKVSEPARGKSRLVLAIPSSAGQAATQDLPAALETHRRDSGDDSLQNFLDRRRGREKGAVLSLISTATKKWSRLSGNSPTDDQIRDFLRCVYVEIFDFGPSGQSEREACGDIRTHLVSDAKQAVQVWKNLEAFFADANQRGARVTGGSLRRALTNQDLRLKPTSDYAKDVARLRELSALNLSRIREHTTLPFGQESGGVVHIQRSEELSALLNAVRSGDLLITGEPGCGKSGLIHQLVETLQKEGSPVLLLLAEEVFGRSWKGSASLPGFVHALDEILANWPDGTSGFLVTDALDAVRDVESQKMLRHLLSDVQHGQSGWKVVASVREFDLKYGRELREGFPGEGVAGYSSNEFANVAHFHLSGLSETQLDELATQRPAIRPFIESARKSTRSAGIHRSPFYLRLAAELLRDGENPVRLADWNSPAVLLRKFWDARVEQGAGADERDVALKSICNRMIEVRSMAISTKELQLSATDLKAVRELRSRGIFQSPALRHGVPVGEEEIRFTHHLLHDYAVARALIPATQARFAEFAIAHSLLPIFYRQSFMFAVEELWDADERREGFWNSALRLEGVPTLHGITRILAPILAARRVETLEDLQPLLAAVSPTTVADSAGHKALQHLSSGLQDADPAAIKAGAEGWSAFAAQLSQLLPATGFLEQPLALMLDRLNAVNLATTASDRAALNTAARNLLAHHVAKKVSKGWRYSASVAIQTLCRTFEVAPADAEKSLIALFSPQRLAQFPHDDLFDLAQSIKQLGAAGDNTVLQLFEAAFGDEPKPGEWEQFGTAILPMRIQSSDQWNSIHYSLAEYYESRNGKNAMFMTEVACIAWNAVARRRGDRRNGEEQILATTEFRGVQCHLIEDYSHIWGREFEHEENRILSHFEVLLREWAAAGDVARVTAALDAFAKRNRTSLMWTVFMEIGAEQPLILGAQLETVLAEPVFLYHPDYAYGSTALLGALHKVQDTPRRERLERLILDLPDSIRSRRPESWEDGRPSSWVQHAQDRLLGALDESNIESEGIRTLWRQRQAASKLTENVKPHAPEVKSHTFSDQELVERRGISLKEPANKEMFRLRDELKLFTSDEAKKLDVREIAKRWPLIRQCEVALQRYRKSSPEMAQELWGYLVGACANIAHRAEWQNQNRRWITIRRILLKAADDPIPEADDDTRLEDSWPAWGWPSPRIDAARGLPFLALRIGKVDEAVAAALRRLCQDKSHPLRFNLADRLAALNKPAPSLMWELIDSIIRDEKKFSVLDALLLSINRLWGTEPEAVRLRLRAITERVMQEAPENNHIFETLTHTHLFHFLRTADSESKAFVDRLVEECDSVRANHALLAQLHTCRTGGWLTAGDAIADDARLDAIRARTWVFFGELLSASQAKLQTHREKWQQVHEKGKPDENAVKSVREHMDRAAHLVDGIAMQLYFASGAFDEKRNKDEANLNPAQTRRFLQEAWDLFAALATELHPHTAYQLVQTLQHLLPYAPRDVFLLASKSIQTSSEARFQYESLAVGEVVKLIQRALADHRDIFKAEGDQESECLTALLAVLDLFVEAGWAEARQLTHRLEEIYR